MASVWSPSEDRSREAPVVLVSGIGEGMPGSGLYAVGAGSVERIDRFATMGIAYDADRDVFARVLHAPNGANSDGEIVAYRSDSVTHRRVVGLKDPHSLGYTPEGELVAVSSFTNEVLWIAEDGTVRRRFALEGEPDSTHLNTVHLDGRSVTVCALGGTSRFQEYRWYVKGDRGVVYDAESGRIVLSGVSSPHDATPFGDGWLVCESGWGRLLEVGPGSPAPRRRQVELGGWTRGLAVVGHVAYVGVSPDRYHSSEGTSHLAVVNLDTFEVDEVIALPCSEIFAVLAVPAAVARRVLEHRSDLERWIACGAVEKGWRDPVGRPAEPLDASECAIEIKADLPSTLEAGELLFLDAVVRNCSSSTFWHIGERLVQLSYRWREACPDGIYRLVCLDEPMRTPLIEPLGPGEERGVTVVVRAPRDPGEYELVLTAVQESVRWFDEADADRLSTAKVSVRPPRS